VETELEENEDVELLGIEGEFVEAAAGVGTEHEEGEILSLVGGLTQIALDLSLGEAGRETTGVEGKQTFLVGEAGRLESILSCEMSEGEATSLFLLGSVGN